MPGNGKPMAGIITVAVFILMEIAALCLVGSTESLQNIWLNRASHRVLAVTWKLRESVRNYFSLNSQNEALALENTNLLSELQACREENNRLRAKVAADTVEIPDGFKYTPAVVVRIGDNSQHNHIIIDKGAEDGITPRSGIVTGHGVVGIVTAVDKHFSYGLTLMNENVSVSSRVRGKDVCAMLEWDGKSSDKALLRKIPMHQDVHPGDTVETNGYSKLYPAGIPLGICGETHYIDGAEKAAYVTLFEDLSTLRYVIVTQNRNLDEIKKLEAE